MRRPSEDGGDHSVWVEPPGSASAHGRARSLRAGRKPPADAALPEAGADGSGSPEIVTDVRAGRRAPTLPAARPGTRKRVRTPGLVRIRSAIAALALLAPLPSGMALLAFKEPVVRAVPAAAPIFAALGLPVNVRGLSFADVHGTLGDQANLTVLTVAGRIDNVRDHSVPVPALHLVLRDGDHHDLYRWTAPAPKTVLAPGESVAFRSRLASPPADAQDVLVGFADVSMR